MTLYTLILSAALLVLLPPSLKPDSAIKERVRMRPAAKQIILVWPSPTDSCGVDSTSTGNPNGNEKESAP